MNEKRPSVARVDSCEFLNLNKPVYIQPCQNPDGTFDLINEDGLTLRLGPGSAIVGWRLVPIDYQHQQVPEMSDPGRVEVTNCGFNGMRIPSLGRAGHE